MENLYHFESNRSVYIFLKRKKVSCAKQNGDKKFTMLHSSSLDCLHDIKINKTIRNNNETYFFEGWWLDGWSGMKSFKFRDNWELN